MFKIIISFSLSLSLMQSCCAMEQTQQESEQHHPISNGWFGGIGQLFRGVNLKPNGLFILDSKNGRIIDQVQGWLANHLVNEVDGRENTLLHVAAQMKNKVVVDLLLEYGQNINVQNGAGDTPLHIAVRVQSKPVVELLLDQHANINVQNGAGDTPLHIALRQDLPNIVLLLLCHETKPEVINNTGNTVFHAAAQSRNDNLIITLLSHPRVTATLQSKIAEEFFIDLRNQHGEAMAPQQAASESPQEGSDTALHIAARNGLSKSITALLANGARKNIVNRVGLTAYDVAFRSGNMAVIGLLQPPSYWSQTKEIACKYKSFLIPVAWALAHKVPIVGPYIQQGETAVKDIVGEKVMKGGYLLLGLPTPTPQSTTTSVPPIQVPPIALAPVPQLPQANGPITTTDNVITIAKVCVMLGSSCIIT